MKIHQYLITAIAAYFIFLIYTVPAAPVISILTGNIKGLSLPTIQGSLWNGSAQAAQYKKHEIRNLNWDFTIWRLFTGEISFDIDALFQDKAITASIGTSLTDTLTIHNLSATLDAYSLGQIADIPIGELAGLIDIEIDDASWSPDSIPNIKGKLLWQKAAIIIAERADLGELSFVIGKNETSPLHTSITNSSGHLDISGNVAVAHDGNYKLEITLKPNTKASQNLRNSLKLVTKPTPTGDYKINKSGSLSQLGLM